MQGVGVVMGVGRMAAARMVILEPRPVADGAITLGVGPGSAGGVLSTMVDSDAETVHA